MKCLSITKQTLFTSLPYTIQLPGTGITVGEIIDQIIKNKTIDITSLTSIQSTTITNTSRIEIEESKFEQHNSNDMSNNALIQFLYRIDGKDIESLQRGVHIYSSAYRYYEYNSTIRNNPLTESILPNGGAIHQLAWRLSKIKEEGILKISQQCQVISFF